jgi:DNA sulfur modification protein DndB
MTMKVSGTEKVTGKEFVATMPASLLMKMTVDPRKTEDQKLRSDDASIQAIYDIRKQVQREFSNSAKARNVEPYADYICRLYEGADGITPSIVLWTSQQLEIDAGNECLPKLRLPWSVELVAIDGETQLAARFEAFKKNPKTADMLVDVKICHDRGTDWARQAFHDLNVLSVRPNAATAVAMDMRDPLTHVTRFIAELPFFNGRVKTDRQLSKKDNGITTFSVLRASIVCFAEGIGGVQYGNKPVPVAEERIPVIRDAATEFYGSLVKKLGPVMEDRLNTVIATPAVLAALGALGHQIINVTGADRTIQIEQILESLNGVDWSKGKHWEGVCGKVRPSGKFSTAGGVKDSAGTTYRALADQTNEYFSKVRSAKAAA